MKWKSRKKKEIKKKIINFYIIFFKAKCEGYDKSISFALISSAVPKL